MIADHPCSGAECPYCAPIALPRIACQQCGILLLSRERWSCMQGGREWSPLCRQCYEERQGPVTPPPAALSAARQAKLAAFRDARGEPVQQWPTESRTSVTACIWNTRRAHVLWVRRRDNGLWVLPGGRHEPGETLQETVQRETWEETGLAVTVERLVCVDADPCQYALNRYPDNLVHHCNLTFVCHTTETAYILNHETIQAQWARPDSMPDPVAPAHAWRYQHALASTGTVPVR